MSPVTPLVMVGDPQRPWRQAIDLVTADLVHHALPTRILHLLVSVACSLRGIVTLPRRQRAGDRAGKLQSRTVIPLRQLANCSKVASSSYFGHRAHRGSPIILFLDGTLFLERSRTVAFVRLAPLALEAGVVTKFFTSLDRIRAVAATLRP